MRDGDLDLAIYLQNDIDTYDYLDMKKYLDLSYDKTIERLKKEVGK